jgi:hypothetical protein
MFKSSAPLVPDPVIEVYKKDVDVTLLRRNLQLTPEERFRQARKLQLAAAELRRAVAEATKR